MQPSDREPWNLPAMAKLDAGEQSWKYGIGPKSGCIRDASFPEGDKRPLDNVRRRRSGGKSPSRRGIWRSSTKMCEAGVKGVVRVSPYCHRRCGCFVALVKISSVCVPASRLDALFLPSDAIHEIVILAVWSLSVVCLVEVFVPRSGRTLDGAGAGTSGSTNKECKAPSCSEMVRGECVPTCAPG